MQRPKIDERVTYNGLPIYLSNKLLPYWVVEGQLIKGYICESPRVVVKEETCNQKFLSSNPVAIFRMDIICIDWFVVNCNVWLKKLKINKKCPGLTRFYKRLHLRLLVSTFLWRNKHETWQSWTLSAAAAAAVVVAVISHESDFKWPLHRTIGKIFFLVCLQAEQSITEQLG